MPRMPYISIQAFAVLAVALSASAQQNKEPVDYVNPKLNKPWFEHSDMVNGGTLVLKMGPRPNTAWGSAPEAPPPSMSH